jgi:imidazole glycerol-phosphate synthase subunit HisH
VIAIVDYGAGNLASVARAFAALAAPAKVTRSAGEVMAADAVVIPGVGHFDATGGMDDKMRAALVERARARPLLGICLGLQFLFEGSDEAPARSGLTLLRGRCSALPASAAAKVPHVGWNTLETMRSSRLLEGVARDAAFYFTHSYAAPVTADTVARTEYAAPFAAVVEARTVFGVQFHPEKSGDAGLRVLRNFLDAV